MEFASFLQYLEHEKRCSSHTLLAYQSDLAQFAQYLTDTYEISEATEVTTPIVRSWVVHLMRAAVAPTSIHRKVSSLKSYYKFLVRQNIIAQSPLQRLSLPKKGERLAIFLQEPQVERLLDSEVFSLHFSGLRDQLLLELLYATGVRRAELISIRLLDIDYGRKALTVFGKRAKTRMIPLSDAILELISGYLAARQQEFPEAHHAELLLTDKGEPLYPKFVYNKVRHYLSLVSTADKRSPHVLRHSFASHLSQHGANLKAIQDLLGHASLAATQIYTHHTADQLKKIYEQAHPKA